MTGAPLVRQEALRRLAAPVTVVTVRHEDRPHGTTISSVTRVSKAPLLMGVCLRGGSAFTGPAPASGS
ncbi:flavin reductase [Streptomyces sp. NPDC037389]|uniref:flavin reductase n=1 Tax=Streptomyces sp. NPDC037389 TaxID=3155369 RepID=UPI0033ED8100